MKIHKGIYYLLLAAAGFLATACTSAEDAPPEESGVKLKLQVVVGEALNQATRADEDIDFEYPELNMSTERLHTLRVIIVRGVPLKSTTELAADFGHEMGDGSGIIEHNRLVTVEDESAQNGLISIINNNLEFLVESGETKTIYLFGNEDAIAADFEKATGTALKELKPGDQFPTEAALNATFSRTKGSPWIDNSNPATPQAPYTNIPMTERFSGIEVPTFESEVHAEIKKTLFIVRTPVKFSFNFTTEDFDPNAEQGLRVTAVRLGGIADSEFIIPNSTTYDPGKYSEDPAVSTAPGRLITQFAMPQNVTFSPLTIAVGDQAGNDNVLQPGMNFSLSPAFYVPETMTIPGRTVTLSVQLNNRSWLGPIELPELTSYELARNTHMRINVTFKGTTTIDAVVDLEPYVGVKLDPVFGIDRPEELPENNENA